MLFTAHSYYSLRCGSMPVEQVVAEAKAKGLREVALADINNTSATTDFIRECQEHGIRPLAGVACHDKAGLKYLLLAKNNEGFSEINDFLSEINIKGLPLPDRAPELERVFVVYPLGAFQDPSPKSQIPSLKEVQSSKFKIQNPKETAESAIGNSIPIVPIAIGIGTPTLQASIRHGETSSSATRSSITASQKTASQHHCITTANQRVHRCPSLRN